MRKYINIFSQDNRKDCYIIDNDDFNSSRKISVGDEIKIKDFGGTGNLVIGHLGYNQEEDEFYINVNGEHIKKIQGIEVI